MIFSMGLDAASRMANEIYIYGLLHGKQPSGVRVVLQRSSTRADAAKWLIPPSAVLVIILLIDLTSAPCTPLQNFALLFHIDGTSLGQFKIETFLYLHYVCTECFTK